VDVDKSDNVWVFSDGPHPVIELGRSGRFLQAWPEFLGKKPHRLRIGPDGNIWTVDLESHRAMNCRPDGRLIMLLGTGSPAADKQHQIRVQSPGESHLRGRREISSWPTVTETPAWLTTAKRASTSASGERRELATANSIWSTMLPWTVGAGCTWLTGSINGAGFRSAGQVHGQVDGLGVIQGLYYVKSEDVLTCATSTPAFSR
jgi:hypothetical protein